MKFFKKIFLLFLFTNLVFGEEDNVEYKIELIVFKYETIESDETFNTNLDISDKNLVYFTDENSLLAQMSHSNFSNMSKFYTNLFKNNFDLILKNLPKPLYRDNPNLSVLNNLKNNINKESKYVLIDSKSWIQTIPEYDYSKYLTYQSQNNYGFLIKFYKKRFMHIDLKAYLGNLDARNSKINIFIDEEKRIFNDELHFFDHPYEVIENMLNSHQGISASQSLSFPCRQNYRSQAYPAILSSLFALVPSMTPRNSCFLRARLSACTCAVSAELLASVASGRVSHTGFL